MRKINEKKEQLIKKISSSKFLIFLDQLLFRIQNNNVFPVGGQLAYFLILSTFPFIMVCLNIFSKTPFVEESLVYSTIRYMPIEVQEIILQFISEVVTSSSQGLLSISIILGIWSSSSGMRAIIRGINTAYGKKENRSFFKLALLSIIFTILIVILLLLVLLSLIFGEVIGEKLFTLIKLESLFELLWVRLKFIILLAYMIFFFSLLYKFSPSSKNKITLKSTLPGAIFGTFTLIFTSILFSYYVSNFGNYTVTYGSLVGIIILLIWLYLSGVIILIGGEINASLSFLKENGFKIHNNLSLVTYITNNNN